MSTAAPSPSSSSIRRRSDSPPPASAANGTPTSSAMPGSTRTMRRANGGPSRSPAAPSTPCWRPAARTTCCAPTSSASATASTTTWPTSAADFSAPKTGEFDQAYMRALYAYGFQEGQDGRAWHKLPPGLAARRHAHAQAIATQGGCLMTQDSSTYWKKSRVELRAAGFEPDRAAKTTAVVTIAGAYTNAHRCNNRVRSITDLLVEILAEHGGQGLIVGAPAVSDALTQGHAHRRLQPGVARCRRRLLRDRPLRPSRRRDDRDLRLRQDRRRRPDAARADQRLRSGALSRHQLAREVSTSAPGPPRATTSRSWTTSRAAPRNEAGRISAEELLELERNVMPGSGTCGAMFTANTMSTIAESIGMMLPRGASHPADYDAKSDIHADVRAQARASVDALYRLIEAGIRPRDIMTERAFENAITTVYAMGGSTNMYLHLLAIAREAQVPITIERIQQIGETRAADRQPAAARALRDGEPARDRRRADRDEGAAARRPAARRRDDRHRQDAGREPRRRADARRRCRRRTSSFR